MCKKAARMARHDSGRSGVISVAIAIVIAAASFYVIAAGPFIALAERRYLPRVMERALDGAYDPLAWLEWNTPLEHPLCWYKDLFRKSEPPPVGGVSVGQKLPGEFGGGLSIPFRQRGMGYISGRT
jgi:hypothetical protein